MKSRISKLLSIGATIVLFTAILAQVGVKIINADPVYVLATDDDFENVKNYRGRYIRYTGTDEYVEIPLFIDGKSVTSYRYMFTGSSVKGVKNSPENSVTDMSYMFEGSKATSLDLSELDTSSVTNMFAMFRGSKATSLDVSGLDTSSVTNMSTMFNGAAATSLDMSGWDTSSVTTMGGMFKSSKATSLNLSGLNTSSVTDMGSMFRYSAATSLDVSGFDTSKVTDMSEMFRGSAATSVDLTPINTDSLTNSSFIITHSSIYAYVTREIKDKLLATGSNESDKDRMIIPIRTTAIGYDSIKEVHEVNVEILTPDDLTMSKYLWSIRDVFDDLAEGWVDITENPIVRIAKSVEEETMYLHVWTTDTKGREGKYVSSPFKFKLKDREIVFFPDIVDKTNTDVIVTIIYPEDSETKEYRIGEDGDWAEYNEPVVIEENTIVYARALNEFDIKTENQLSIGNIDRIPPTLTEKERKTDSKKTRVTIELEDILSGLDNVKIPVFDVEGNLEEYKTIELDGKHKEEIEVGIPLGDITEYEITAKDKAGNETTKAFKSDEPTDEPPVEELVTPPVTPRVIPRVTPPVEEPAKSIQKDTKPLPTKKEKEIFISKIPFTLPLGKFSVAELLGLDPKDFADPIIEVIKGVQDIEVIYRGKEITFDLEGVNPEGIKRVYKDIVKHHWALNAIAEATENGFLVGIGDDIFEPKATLNYGDAYTAINRVVMKSRDITMMSGRGMIESINNNVVKDYWAYYNTSSIFTKIGANNTRNLLATKGEVYKTAITREELAVTLYNLILEKNLPETNKIIMYSDMSFVPAHIEYCGRTGLMIGDNKGNFNPEYTLNRAELAEVVIRLHEIIKK